MNLLNAGEGLALRSSYRALGSDLDVWSRIPGVVERLDDLLAPFRIDAPLGDPVVLEASEVDGEFPYRLVVDGTRLGDFGSSGVIAEQAVIHLTTRAAERATEHVTVHAGVVAGGDGAILLVGPPDAGKSTLTAALVQAGFGYLSDEVAPIRLLEPVVDPFPRPVVVDDRAVELLAGRSGVAPPFGGRRHITADTIRPGSLAPAAPIRHVLQLDRGDGAATMLTPLPRAEALHLLLVASFNGYVLKSAAVASLTHVVESAVSVQRLSYPDLTEAVAAVSDL